MPDVPQWPHEPLGGKPAATTIGGPETTLAGVAGTDGATSVSLTPVGIGARMASGLIDVVLVVFGGVIYTLLLGSDSPTGELAKASSLSMRFNNKQVTGGAVWLFVVLGLLYFFVTELVIGGSIGKRILHQRVVMNDGSKLTAGGAALRTLLRPIDGFPWVLPNLLGFIVVAVNGNHRRIGDFVGGTRVVKRD